MKSILDYIKDRILVFDGSMGRELQKRGLPDNIPPELWNAERPEIIEALHRSYVEAGAAAVTTNTFGGSRSKLAHYNLGHRVAELNQRGVELAKKAVGDLSYVVGSIGPTGSFVEPLGELTFDKAYQVFYEQAKALAEAGADAIILETMADLGEMRVALIAAKDASDLPIIASMTYDQNNRTLTGTDPETAAVVLESLGADVIGVNCSGGPEQLLPIAATLCRSTNLPVLVEPNAGMPELEKGITVYKETPESMAEFAAKCADLGAEMIGSCCGSTPEHTLAIANVLTGRRPIFRKMQFPLRIASRFETISVGLDTYPVIVGERINPTGKKDLAAEIREGKTALLKSEALSQVKGGADILDVNVAVPGTDEAQSMERAVTAIQSLVQVPLCLDSPNPAALEKGLRSYHGKALVNSVNADEAVMEKVLPLVKRYGAAVVALCMDEQGIPDTVKGRIGAAAKIVERARELGIPRENIIVDCLTLTASTDSQAPATTLECVKRVRERLGVPTVLGVSNISFGLPQRPLLNSAFLSAAVFAGLDAAIINPLDRRMVEAFRASAVIAGRDKGAERYIEYCVSHDKTTDTGQPPSVGSQSGISDSLFGGTSRGASGSMSSSTMSSDSLPKVHPLTEAVIRGDKEGVVPLLEQYLEQGLNPMELLDLYLIPGIGIVGDKYGKGEYFLPQLMLSADTMQAAFSRLQPELDKGEKVKKNTVVLATVKGDIHDIGKNIVSIMLRNHGFEVVDLGKNVPNETILEAAQEHQAEIVGLSALMTTTMPRMEEIVSAIRSGGMPFKVVVGGAAVTQRYADEIGADGYGKDAVAAVEIVKRLIEINKSE